ncbi:MAG TPA: DUF4177 domain-containing protein, partial [Lachnospiraceae bacterium]|nr:DUF4177 domain-containing protein [Lachnospiraceae bacterium]HPF30526.1 DUF4177 domain-containing protein [Lachnospiraceae bacterium]
MVDVNQIMFEMIRKCNCIATNNVNEIEEIVDTGLEKTEENIQKVALEYLDEKGYARRIDNLDRAKQHIIESSMYSDTVRVRKKREMVEDLLTEASEEELEKMLNVCTLDNLMKMNEKMDTLVNRQYEYTVEILSDILSDADNVGNSLTEFESFRMMLNRYAKNGWRMVSVTAREGTNHRLSMSGFQTTTRQVVVVFERMLGR